MRARRCFWVWTSLKRGEEEGEGWQGRGEVGQGIGYGTEGGEFGGRTTDGGGWQKLGGSKAAGVGGVLYGLRSRREGMEGLWALSPGDLDGSDIRGWGREQNSRGPLFGGTGTSSLSPYPMV